MALTYLRTCAGGNHHVFQDDETGETVVYVTEELESLGLEAKAASAFMTSLEATDLAQRIPGIGTRK